MMKYIWPDIQDMQDAKKALNMGVGVCVFVAIGTTIVIFLQTSGTINLFPGIGYSAFLDVALFSVLGILIKFHSRLAALGALLLYVGEQAYMMSQSGRFNYVGIIFTLYLISSVRGAFAYHRFKKLDQEQGQQPVAPPQVYNAASAGQEAPSGGKNSSIVLILVLAVVLIAGLGIGFWFLSQNLSKSGKGFSLPKLTGKIIPSSGKASGQLKPPSPTDPSEIVAGSGKVITLSLKNGKQVTGEIIYEDETYYTLKSGGGQEIIIKEDVKK